MSHQQNLNQRRIQLYFKMTYSVSWTCNCECESQAVVPGVAWDCYCHTFKGTDVEWRIGSTHDSGARGPGFDSDPDPVWHFFNRKNSHLHSFRHQTLKRLHSFVILWCQVELNINLLCFFIKKLKNLFTLVLNSL